MGGGRGELGECISPLTFFPLLAQRAGSEAVGTDGGHAGRRDGAEEHRAHAVRAGGERRDARAGVPRDGTGADAQEPAGARQEGSGAGFRCG